MAQFRASWKILWKLSGKTIYRWGISLRHVWLPECKLQLEIAWCPEPPGEQKIKGENEWRTYGEKKREQMKGESKQEKTSGETIGRENEDTKWKENRERTWGGKIGNENRARKIGRTTTGREDGERKIGERRRKHSSMKYFWVSWPVESRRHHWWPPALNLLCSKTVFRQFFHNPCVDPTWTLKNARKIPNEP